MLVTRAAGLDLTLVLTKRCREKPRLREHAIRSAIVLGISRERLVEKLFEPGDIPRLAPQLVVKTQHFRHKPWSQPRTTGEADDRASVRHCTRRGAGRGLRDDVAIV